MALLQGTGIPPHPGNFTTGNGTVQREASVAGLGIAVLPSFMVVFLLEREQGYRDVSSSAPVAIFEYAPSENSDNAFTIDCSTMAIDTTR